jgi:chromosome segregation ATPase
MEKGFFQSKLSQPLDMISMDQAFKNEIPTPDELPEKIDLSSLSEDQIKSATFENLISQNEDLMNRLKVNLRRLSTLESENKKVIDENQKLKISYASISDKLLVFKEKDSSWKEKINFFENQIKELKIENADLMTKIHFLERDQQEFKNAVEQQKKVEIQKIQADFRIQVEMLEQNINNLLPLKLELERYKKYQDKINHQVKPYIESLKETVQKLQKEIDHNKFEINIKDTHVRDLKNQILEISKNAKLQIQASEQTHVELINHYEVLKKDLERELVHLTETSKFYESKIIKLDQALERNDFLENKVIAHQREKEQMIAQFDSENEEVRSKMVEFRQDNQRKELQIQQLNEANEKLSTDIKLHKTSHELIEGQLESLRFLYNEKNDEVAQLKQSLNAFEKINSEISQKLHELRKKEIEIF